MKRMLFVVLLALSCSRTGLDEEDAGLDGGALDAGIPGCVTPSDCPATLTSPQCFGGGNAKTSCVLGQCLFDCDSSRTCVGNAGCVTCAAESCSSCLPLDAPPNVGRISRSCVGAPELLGGFNFASSGACAYSLSTDAGTTGTLDGRGAGLARLDGAGCTIHVLATGLNRVELACGACVYLLEWP